MRTLPVAFALSLFVSLLLTRLIRDLANRRGWVDKPAGGRNLHTKPVPRLGGVAVVLAFALPLVGLVFYQNDYSILLLGDRPFQLALLGGGGLIVAVGLVDDLVGTRALVKLAGQVAAALVVYWAGLHIDGIALPFIGRIHLGIFSLPVTIFWFVLVTNAINLIDGMDGLAGGVVMLAGGTLLVLSAINGSDVAAVVLASLLGATGGFLFFNIRPASIFLGDTGSLFLGFMLALVSVHSSQKSYAVFSLLAALMALGLPIFDLSMAVVRRYLMGQPIFRADQHHIHHVLLRKGLTQSQSVVLLYGAGLTLSLLSLATIFADDRISALVMVVMAGLVALAARFLGYTEIIRDGRRSVLLSTVHEQGGSRSVRLQEIRERAHAVCTIGELWGLVVDSAELLGLERATLELEGGGRGLHPQGALSWVRVGAPVEDDAHLEALRHHRFTLKAGQQQLGVLDLSVLSERQLLAPLDQIHYQILADTLTFGLLALVDKERVEA